MIALLLGACFVFDNGGASGGAAGAPSAPMAGVWFGEAKCGWGALERGKESAARDSCATDPGSWALLMAAIQPDGRRMPRHTGPMAVVGVG